MPAPLNWTSYDDAAIRRIYETTDVCEQRQRKREFVARSTWSEKQVYFRAIQIGALRPTKKDPKWTEEEDEFILKRAGLEVQKTRKLLIRAGFYPRSLAAIGRRLWVLTGSLKTARQDAGVYTANDVANLLGVNSGSVARWCRMGMLKARAGAPMGAHPVWWIEEKDIRRFVIEHTGLVNFGRVDKFWLVDLLVQNHGSKTREAA